MPGVAAPRPPRLFRNGQDALSVAFLRHLHEPGFGAPESRAQVDRCLRVVQRLPWPRGNVHSQRLEELLRLPWRTIHVHHHDGPGDRVPQQSAARGNSRTPDRAEVETGTAGTACRHQAVKRLLKLPHVALVRHDLPRRLGPVLVGVQ